MVDNTLFTKKSKSHLIIVQICVDDIIFGSTNQNLCDDFAKIMHEEFEMSMMGELNFFLGLQIKQIEDGILFNQSKYVKEILKKFGLEDSKPTKTPMSTEIKLTKEDEAYSVDSSKYRDYGSIIRRSVYGLGGSVCDKSQEVINKRKGPMPFAMLLTLLHSHIHSINPQAIVLITRFTFQEHVIYPLDISRKFSKEKGKKFASPSVISSSSSSSSSSSDDNEAPSFLEFYDELSDSEDLTKAQREKRGMLKCLNRYVGTITKYLEKQK
nr:copia protein [Tanacetum cinerariifolium]